MDPVRVHLHGVRAGGGVVDMTLHPSQTDINGQAPLDAVASLYAQLQDPSSVLMRGRHTGASLSVEVCRLVPIKGVA